ncbi:hypothetical protein A2W14_06980 [Candidatus Gottesmanbacteria bacterium RBG_16_37_8]|uniref:Uncharacterized protein n=1 Tax=Candidatus Gottesmanbacteria bacterium RBG_16_37_8 TaxID=1798371 RepID=A0A1F5YSR2_9BACT|nr:MAG: hypothetical protein A2W14_06980 [Candidatus Gottesmanbacteria bacterium RBG_16_37_8]
MSKEIVYTDFRGGIGEIPSPNGINTVIFAQSGRGGSGSGGGKGGDEARQLNFFSKIFRAPEPVILTPRLVEPATEAYLKQVYLDKHESTSSRPPTAEELFGDPGE